VNRPTDHKASETGSSLEDDSLLRKIAHVSEADAPPAMPSTIEVPAGSGEREQMFTPRELPRVGSTIDERYLIEDVLGEGGMGVVFAARNLRTGRQVALKLMIGRERLSYGEAASRSERFVREARAAGRIRHPNVVDVYDVGGDSQTPYLVMERLNGRTLGALIAEKPLTERRAIELVMAAAQGVSAAHREGVIHRDLKPDNIFLADTNEGPVPKVLDFGISRIVAASESLHSLTRSGTILGTPAYMPYEQLRGGREVDARADVYALGVILYEALSGRRPFEAHNLHDLVLRMAHDEPTPLAEVAPATSEHIRSVVARCLSREPDHRYADAGAFAEALQRALDAPEEVEHRPGVPAPRNARRAWVLGAALVLAVGVLWLVFARSASHQVVPQQAFVQPSVKEMQPSPARSPVAEPAQRDTQLEPLHVLEPSPGPERAPASHKSRPAARDATQSKIERARELRPSDF
jgi:serine/threonine protein kinase